MRWNLMQGFGERVYQRGFAEAGNAFEQDVAATDDGAEHLLNDVLLPDDEFGDFGSEFFERFLEVNNGNGSFGHEIRVW